MKPFKLRTKLTLTSAGVMTLLLVTAVASFYNLLAYQMNSALRAELVERAAALRGYLHIGQGQARLEYDANDPDEAFFVGNATRYFQIYDAEDGTLVVRSQPLEALQVQYSHEEVKELLHTAFADLDTDQVDLLFHNELVRPGDGRSYLFQVGTPLTPRDNALNQLLRTIYWLLPFAVGLAVFSGWWITGRVLRPIESLTAAARTISISELHRRLPLTGTGDELDQLANTFNDMFGRLEKAVGQMKEFTASISHELRTPLTVLRGEAEVALVKAQSEEDYRRALESQLEEFGKLSRMIDHMLILARAEAGQIPLAKEVVDLSLLTHSLVDQMEAVAASKEITLGSETGAGVSVIGDPGWLERVVLNLLDNAIKFTPEGGRIHVSVERMPDEAVLEVRDNGIGITPQALPHIFELFYRGDASRSNELGGAGLGLSLVEWIVRAHNGRISVESQPGHGTAVRVSLPPAASSSASISQTAARNPALTLSGI